MIFLPEFLPLFVCESFWKSPSGALEKLLLRHISFAKGEKKMKYLFYILVLVVLYIAGVMAYDYFTTPQVEIVEVSASS